MVCTALYRVLARLPCGISNIVQPPKEISNKNTLQIQTQPCRTIGLSSTTIYIFNDCRIVRFFLFKQDLALLLEISDTCFKPIY